MTVTNSTISGNTTLGRGGGIDADSATITNSTISGNFTTGNGASGGGLFAINELTVTNSTITGNSVKGADLGRGWRVQLLRPRDDPQFNRGGES